jgi:hypothetical protein
LLIGTQVEDTLFRVPRHEFEETSEVFSDMFRLPTGEGSLQTADGSSDENPILLEGHKAVDFANLLKILYLRYSLTKLSIISRLSLVAPKQAVYLDFRHKSEHTAKQERLVWRLEAV